MSLINKCANFLRQTNKIYYLKRQKPFILVYFGEKSIFQQFYPPKFIALWSISNNFKSIPNRLENYVTWFSDIVWKIPVRPSSIYTMSNDKLHNVISTWIIEYNNSKCFLVQVHVKVNLPDYLWLIPYYAGPA